MKNPFVEEKIAVQIVLIHLSLGQSDYKQIVDFKQNIGYIFALKFTIHDMINEIKCVMAASEGKKIWQRLLNF